MTKRETRAKIPLTEGDTTPHKRKRRSTAAVRDLIMESARELFATVGYGRASIRAIAEHAGVLPHLVHRNIGGGKAMLFEQAVFLPFEEMLEQHYKNTWVVRRRDMEGAVERTRSYIEALYDQLRADRQLWRALVLAIQTHQNELDHLLGDASPLLRYFERLVETARPSMDEMGWELNTDIAVRITFGSLFTMALFDDLLFGRRRPDKKLLIEEMTHYALFGVAGRRTSDNMTGRLQSGHGHNVPADQCEAAAGKRKRPGCRR
ncbi:helix-turn-helix domain-containing protein [Caballeronia sp. LZ001]|uniref:TetR/AcrR family transcriptional regulator n=1 Tax=Caballeronia sp. LZ001 TaxID=3038553 RepID=UPI0028579264|nr:helix-turn-helix domain-containing protein [Caballeronia sp. LZ001]MDR5804843.1 helix-turn-helix domain containing protein [Caballeronia sp. LZ001]